MNKKVLLQHTIITCMYLLQVLLILVVLGFLKPVEKLSIILFELEEKDTPSFALRDMLQLSIARKYYKVLPTEIIM